MKEVDFMSNVMSVENLTAVQNVQQDEQVLGHLMWFSVGAQLIDRNMLQKKLQEAGVPDSFMPNAIRPFDAFKRATRESETKRHLEGNKTQNFIVREVCVTDDIIQRNIVIETVDQNGKRLDYESEAAIITLEREHGNIVFTTSDEFVRELCDEIVSKYHTYKDFYAAEQLRSMVGKILKSLAPTPVRPNGGIYFVPNTHTKELDKMIQFVSSLENSQGFKIPVVDTFDNQKMVAYTLMNHLDKVLTKCNENELATKAKVKETILEARAVVENYKNYQGLLDNTTEFENKITQIRTKIQIMLANIEN